MTDVVLPPYKALMEMPETEIDGMTMMCITCFGWILEDNNLHEEAEIENMWNSLRQVAALSYSKAVGGEAVIRDKDGNERPLK